MRLRTLNEAAEALGVSRRRLREGIRRGIYPAVPWKNRLLVDIDELKAIIEKEDAERAARAGEIGLKECAEAIGLTGNVLRSMALAGLVPYHKAGRYYRFRLEDVQAALREKMK